MQCDYCGATEHVHTLTDSVGRPDLSICTTCWEQAEEERLSHPLTLTPVQTPYHNRLPRKSFNVDTYSFRKRTAMNTEEQLLVARLHGMPEAEVAKLQKALMRQEARIRAMQAEEEADQETTQFCPAHHMRRFLVPVEHEWYEGIQFSSGLVLLATRHGRFFTHYDSIEHYLEQHHVKPEVIRWIDEQPQEYLVPLRRVIPTLATLDQFDLDRIRAVVREELANAQTPVPANHVSTSPHPKELQEKFLRLGWGTWVPTPGVEDEDREIYLTLNGEHFHVMSVEEALSLSDDELKRRMEEAMNARVQTPAAQGEGEPL